MLDSLNRELDTIEKALKNIERYLWGGRVSEGITLAYAYNVNEEIRIALKAATVIRKAIENAG
jgi:hypothetical protein